MNQVQKWVILLSLLVTSMSVSCSTYAVTRDDPTADKRQSLVHNGKTRYFLVRAPLKLSTDQKVPLVIVLHGGGGNARNAEKMTGFTEKAKAEKFIVVYPEGTGRRADKLLTWNAGHCCGHAMKSGVDDVGFISAMLDQLIKDYAVDSERIYVTGLSNGGMMTHRLGRELSTRIAAIAPVIATVFGDEKPPRSPVAALMINGALDESVPYQGGAPGGRFARAWDGTPVQPALAQANFWAAANRCQLTPESIDQLALVTWEYTCPSDAAVKLVLVKDNGHAWPSGKPGSRRADTPSQSLNATNVIWDFFREHQKTLLKKVQ